MRLTEPEERVRVRLCTGVDVHLRRVDAIGTRTGQAIIKGRIVDVTDKVYPEPAYDLRALRHREPQLLLRQTAVAMGLRPSELSRLECGSVTLSEEHWQALFVALGRAP